EPRTETERLLADIWAESLGLPDIGRDDDFFDLGGDSLAGAVVAARIHAVLGVELTLGEIADHPTIVALAALIDGYRRTPSAGLPPIVPVSRGSAMPVSLFQELMWKYQREHRSAPTSVRTYRVIGPLDIEILKECLRYLIDRHEILRTTFGLVQGSLAQIVFSSAPLGFKFIDLIAADDLES